MIQDKSLKCANCGKPATVDALCDSCFLSKNKLFEIKDLMIKICECGAYYSRQWRKSDDFINDLIRSNIKSNNRIKDVKVSVKKIGNKIHVNVECTGYIWPAKTLKKETKKILIITRNQKCDDCVKVSGGYYEALIQVRGKDQEVIFKKIRRIVVNKCISGIEKLKEGYNIKFVNKSDAANVARQLSSSYDVVDSYKLVAKKKGKELYRNFYCIR